MAEPLKNSFGVDVVAYIAGLVGHVTDGFDRESFSAACASGFDDLELMARAQQIADVLVAHLSSDPAEVLRTLLAALEAEEPPKDLPGMEAFRYLPIVDVVRSYGLDHFELSMELQYVVTQRFTAEFSIRSFLEAHREATLDRLAEWATDPSEHVRRLVSEGTRPRLPWAPQLRSFIDDPKPVIELLERLKDDPSEYVRRSVANNINDIAKDNPDLAVGLAERWWSDAGEQRQRLVKHALRTLVKRGHPGALAVLGYEPHSPLRVASVTATPDPVCIGDRVRLSIELHNPGSVPCRALVDIVVHFVKANGSTTPKVFKGAEILVEANDGRTITKVISFERHTTRTPYPGLHSVGVLINGIEHPAISIDVNPPPGDLEGRAGESPVRR